MDLIEINLEMVFIPSGTFWMGTPNEERESPQHQVTLESFYLSKYPITQAQWQAIAHRTDLKVSIDLDTNLSRFKGENNPVEQVMWVQAVEFCQRLSKLTGKDYQLPSEAQWEYACRSAPMKNGENVGEQGLRPTSSELTQEAWHKNYEKPFYFGETITSELANYVGSETYYQEPKGKYRQETTPVGSFPPNVFGLYDMHGNVWEWCADQWHSNYEGAPNDGSAWHNNISFSKPYVIRSGSWDVNPFYCRSAFRNSYLHVYRYYAVGFRVMCAVGKTL